MHNVQIKHVVYQSSIAGKTLVVTGAVHGDEHCGNKAINRLIEAFDNGDIKLKSGKVILVPKCNPMAFEQNTRFIDRNLNRYLFPKDNPQNYEDYIDPILCDILKQADILLDLHSYESSGEPFIFLSTDNKYEEDFARNLGVRDFVCGWADAFGSNKKSDSDQEGMGTTEYARLNGAIAATLECGNHLNEDAPDVGYNASIRAMQHSGLLEETPNNHNDEKSNQRLVRMREVYYRKEGATLAKKYSHFEPVSKDEVMVLDQNHKPTYKAPCDGYVVLPKHNVKGNEWFYFGSVDKF
jgi:predicted deacylase